MAVAQDEDDIWKRKYLTLESRVKTIELENQRLVHKIYHVRKYLRRCRQERSFLIEKCDQFGVDYKTAQRLYTESLLADLDSPPLEEVRPQIKKRPTPAVTSKKPKITKTQTKVEKERDPDAPKKPANAFFMFCQQQRNSMQDDPKDTSVGHHELTKHLAKEWNTLAADSKKKYYKMYEKDKERYEQEMKVYSKDKPTEKTKSSKTKKQKAKKTKPSAISEPSIIPSNPPASLVDPTSEPHNPLVHSPPFNLLNTLPFSNLPSPMMEIGGDDDESFGNFDL